MMTPTQFSMVVFIVITIAQIVVFIWYPALYAIFDDFEKGPEYPSFRLIGVNEIGLMAIYTSAVMVNDTFFMGATVAGRLSVILFATYAVVVVGVGLKFFLSVIQDLLFGTWTLITLLRAKESTPRPLLSDKASMKENLTRLVIFATGALDVFFGAQVCFHPVTYSETPIIDASISIPPHYLGIRAFGFATFVIGSYQVLLALQRAPPLTYIAVGFHHLIFGSVAPILGDLVGNPALQSKLDIPKFHSMAGPVILICAALVAEDHARSAASNLKGDTNRKKKSI